MHSTYDLPLYRHAKLGFRDRTTALPSAVPRDLGMFRARI